MTSKIPYIISYFLLIIGFSVASQNTVLPSGFYFINNSKGIERVLEDTQDHFFISPKAITSISTIARVKTQVIKTKVYTKIEKKYGLRFHLNNQGKEAMQKASKKTFEARQRIALIINDTLVLAPYINYEITDGTFFIEIDKSKKEVNAIEKYINTAIKAKH